MKLRLRCVTPLIKRSVACAQQAVSAWLEFARAAGVPIDDATTLDLRNLLVDNQEQIGSGGA